MVHSREQTDSLGTCSDQTDFTSDVICSSQPLSQSFDFVSNYMPITKSIVRLKPVDSGHQNGLSGRLLSARSQQSCSTTSNATAEDDESAVTEFTSPDGRESSPSAAETNIRECQPPKHYNGHWTSCDLNDVVAATSCSDADKTMTFSRDSRNIRWTAVSVLVDLRPTVRFQRMHDESSVPGLFSVSITVDEQQFQGVARSARLAAEQAAENALRRVFGLDSLVEYIRQTTCAWTARPASS
jgi:hypothetical protein